MLLVAGAETDYRVNYSIPTIVMEGRSAYRSTYYFTPCTSKYCTAIEVAANFNHPETVNLLLKAGGDANTLIKGYLNFKGLLLHEACLLDQPEVVKMLIDGGADVNVKENFTDQEGEYTPLGIAVRLGYETIVKLLVSGNLSGSAGLDTDIIRKARSEYLYRPLAIWKKMTIMQDLGYCTNLDMTAVKYQRDFKRNRKIHAGKLILCVGKMPS